MEPMKLWKKTDITSSQPAAPKPTSPIQPAPTRQQRTPQPYNIQHYIGATIWGFIATGTIAMVLTGGALALSAVAGILGAGGGAFLMNMYKNSSGKSLFGEGKFLFGEPYKNWDLPKEHRQSAPAPTQRERHRQAYEATIKERESKLARVETGFLQEETQTQECEKCRQTNPSPTPSGASATCPKCGDTSPDEATHCISCGNQLPELI
ncbi:MAG TPA: hypothetical protein DCS57_04525 [Dehalococcoidia bacterium]|nr:hypothetical protein [Dehalococcoidia bacterium]